SEHVFSTHLVFMGMTENALRRQEQVSILPKDIQSLHQSLGFSLPVLEDSQIEFVARWLFEDLDRTFLITTPLSDFDGDVETPSLLWLSGANEQGVDIKKVSVPQTTRWDELQSVTPEEIGVQRSWDQTQIAQVSESVRHDQGEKDFFFFGGELIKSLSASAFE